MILSTAQGEKSSRPSTAAPSREISVQNLSNQGLGSPTKVSQKISPLQNEQTKSNLSFVEVEVGWTIFQEGNLGCLSHFGQGQPRLWAPDHDPSKWRLLLGPPQTWTITRALTKIKAVSWFPETWGEFPRSDADKTPVPKFSSFTSICTCWWGAMQYILQTNYLE